MDVHFPNQIPFLNKSTAYPPSKWNKKKTKQKNTTGAISCLVLCSLTLRPSLPTTSPRLPTPAPVLAFWLSGFSPPPSLRHPHGPPLTPCYPPSTPSPSLSPGQASSSQPFVPSFPSLLLHLCLPLPLCVRGQQRERGEGGCRGGEMSWKRGIL